VIATVEDDAEAGPDLRWLVEVLWGGLEGISVTLRQPTAGRVLERYAVVPSARRPRLLLPLDRRAAWAIALDAPATRSRGAALQRVAAGVAARSGFLPFRDRLSVVADPAADPASTIAARIATALGTPVTLGVNVRPPGPYRKPVLAVAGPGGRLLAYAKVGWNAPTAENVEAEASVLRAIAAADGRRPFFAPEILGAFRWRDRPVVVTRPLPAGLRRYDARTGAPSIEITRRVASLFATGEATYGDGPIRPRLRRRAAALPADEATVAELGALLETLDRLAGTRLPFGGWHGDWSPWNLADGPDGLWIWDWEYARPDVPLGLDVAHFHFQVAFVRERRGLAVSLERAHTAAAASLERLGLDPQARSLARAVHVAELALRSGEAQALGAPANPRFAAEVVPVLRSAAQRIADRSPPA
jgi:hypothetical protein